MLHSEYLRFLQTLNSDSISEDERKLGNLILADLDQLAGLGTSQGKRAKAIVELAQLDWNSLSSEIKPLPPHMPAPDASIERLDSLKVGPFRGFSKEENFDLSSKTVLIYGPNGTGKSSFCEALEYSLLGSVAEAESKRFREQQKYLKNAFVNDFVVPELYGINVHGDRSKVVSNSAVYRFCFVEKNRIDSFSRIAAQSPSKQTELISTLFGLDSFTEFVRKFSSELDSRHIDLSGEKAAILAEKKQLLEGAELQITQNEAELVNINADETALALKYPKNISFSQMDLEIHGTEGAVGLISQLESYLQQPLKVKTNLSVAALDELSASLKILEDEIRVIKIDLSTASEKISYKNLYTAIIQLKESSSDNCPACETPLEKVTIDPFANSEVELQNLQQLVHQQESLAALEKRVNQKINTLIKILDSCLSYNPSSPLKTHDLSDSAQTNIDWFNSLQQAIDDDHTQWDQLRIQIQKHEKSDIEIDKDVETNLAKKVEVDSLREVSQAINMLRLRRRTANQAVSAAKVIISEFDKANEELIAEARSEVPRVKENNTISEAYKSFVVRLNSYKNSLPALLVADLGEKVVQLYNLFNRSDSNLELLSEVKLPLAQEQRLEISFRNDPGQHYDALHVLSEGHIRCIGLAILLAKNLKEECPLLIFDDPVNAIDDDHRESIRRTLFEDSHFNEKQIILTCHGEEFFKDIQNLLPVEKCSQAKSFVFLPRQDEPNIQVDFDCAPRNYIMAARMNFDKNEKREALAQSRKAMESLTKDKIWRYVSKHGDGNLSLKLRGHKMPIELRNLTEQLKKKIDSASFSDADKSTILEPINELLGVNGGAREWSYLNKGTHEESDRSEFDRSTVSKIICALEALDKALS